ncbi:GNAT family acetyltransferase YjcF [hydrothermal vent metagenome]|uniref:GNAT family acetyltransferase YjcF n=1 Tax=hydrothermal vent metagenome TaxID=652676 RepID=A0A3B0ZHZ9_9ZZZZ
MIRVEQVSWADKQALIRPIREAVFIQEQNVPVELEWDGLDGQCVQLLLLSVDKAVGTARMTANGKIGRMAVLREHRGYGGGQLLLSKLIQVAKAAQLSEVVLDAQVSAIPFYLPFGFEVVSEPFMDAGIMHRQMMLALS